MSEPLNGLVVLDLTRLLPGPLCSLYLADFGARVIKIEDRIGGDPLRHMPHLFNLLNRNKESLALNLKDETDLKSFYELVKTADIVIESFRPNVPQKLKIDYETLKKINPKIIYCSITGYGQTGPMKDQAGTTNYMA
ncbi:MAG: CoA transferase [Bacteriovoracaceae bacterium]